MLWHFKTKLLITLQILEKKMVLTSQETSSVDP